jgi:hypothetical protein
MTHLVPATRNSTGPTGIIPTMPIGPDAYTRPVQKPPSVMLAPSSPPGSRYEASSRGKNGVMNVSIRNLLVVGVDVVVGGGGEQWIVGRFFLSLLLFALHRLAPAPETKSSQEKKSLPPLVACGHTQRGIVLAQGMHRPTDRCDATQCDATHSLAKQYREGGGVHGVRSRP